MQHDRLPSFVLLTLVACASVSCDSKSTGGLTAPTQSADTTTVLTSISISGTTAFTAVGQTLQLAAIASFSNATTENVTTSAVWRTSNPVVAVVSGTGLLTAQGVGATQVTATTQDLTGTADVTVSGPPTPACTVTLSETAVTFGRPGGSRSVGVQTSVSSCSWQTTSDENWLRITSGSGGSGNGMVSYHIDENTGTVAREGAISIGGQTLHVRQTPDDGGCGFPFCYSVDPMQRVVPSAGGSFSFVANSVSSTGAPGAWEVYSVPPWVAITAGRSATGSATVTYSVQPNSSVFDREGDIVVGGISRQFPPAVHRVTQRGR